MEPLAAGSTLLGLIPILVLGVLVAIIVRAYGRR